MCGVVLGGVNVHIGVDMRLIEAVLVRACVRVWGAVVRWRPKLASVSKPTVRRVPVRSGNGEQLRYTHTLQCSVRGVALLWSGAMYAHVPRSLHCVSAHVCLRAF